MKCEKCNGKEATFFYSCSINGQKTERRLCADCAKEEGLYEAFDFSPAAMFDDAFENFFEPFGSLLPSFGSARSAFGRIMAPAFPRLRVRMPELRPAADTAESSVPADMGEEVRLEREREALRAQLASAVEREDFEKAIELRDKLKGLGK